MSRPQASKFDITPELVLRAYAAGIFPMADSADDPNLHWIEPQLRGVIPLNAFHVPRRLARTIRQDKFDIRVNRDFDRVIDHCAQARRQASGGEGGTWINARIRTLYRGLFDLGHCCTVEAYEDGALAGGLYGVSLGAAFFGESMFQLSRDASKAALAHLAARLIRGGYMLLDAQFQTAHLEQFGTVEVPRRAYRKLLDAAAGSRADFNCKSAPRNGAEVLAVIASASVKADQ